MTRLLLLEDEPRISGFIKRGLHAEGFDVTVVVTGSAALDAARAGGYDLIVLDVMLPDMSGMDVCERLRAGGVATPIMMLTARDADEDIVDGLARGADDYLAKPFSFDVLLARLEALSRRAHMPWRDRQPTVQVEIGPLSLDARLREGSLSGAAFELTQREFDVLWLLASEPDRVHSRERILAAAWGANADPLTNVVDVYVARLRKKLAEPSAPEIATVRGVGYRMRERG